MLFRSRDWQVNLIWIAVGIEQSDDLDPNQACFVNSVMFLSRVNNDDRLWQAVHLSQTVDVALIDDVLKAVDLEHLTLIDQDMMHWSQRLSGGEQQRLAIARAILQAPDWLFLDEAMSALPEPAQVSMLALLRARLPQVTLVSISHSAALSGQYTQHLEFVIDRDGQPQLVLVEGGES